MYSWTGSSLRTEVETPSFSQSTECRWLAAAPCTVTLPLLAQLYYLHLFACWNCCISGGNSYILSISRRCVCVCVSVCAKLLVFVKVGLCFYANDSDILSFSTSWPEFKLTLTEASGISGQKFQPLLRLLLRARVSDASPVAWLAIDMAIGIIPAIIGIMGIAGIMVGSMPAMGIIIPGIIIPGIIMLGNIPSIGIMPGITWRGFFVCRFLGLLWSDLYLGSLCPLLGEATLLAPRPLMSQMLISKLQ